MPSLSISINNCSPLAQRRHGALVQSNYSIYLFRLNYNIYNTITIRIWYCLNIFVSMDASGNISWQNLSSLQSSGRVHPFDARMRKAELPAAMSWEEFRSLGPWVGGSFFFRSTKLGRNPGGFTSAKYLGGGFIFTPTWGRFPIWLIFFRWVETTNQI